MTGQGIAPITAPARDAGARNSVRAALRAADQARDRGDWLNAIEHYRSYLEARPRRFPIWVQYGHALKESGRRAAALAAYSEALRLNPADADLLLNLGHLHKMMGHREEAISFYRQSARIDPNPAVIGEMEQLGAQFDRRDSQARTAPLARPRRNPLHAFSGARPALKRGNEARDRRDWPAAVDAYRAYLRSRPDNFPIWVQLGHALKESGRLDASLDAYRRAMSLRPDDADLLLNLGHLHKLMDRRDEAEGFYRRSFEQDGNANARQELDSLGSTAKPVERLSDQDSVVLNSTLSASPLVSIIIPNFNGRRHLDDLFTSLSNQTYRNFEVIFVDDNSSDDSAGLAERLGASKVIRTSANVGFATANNLGLQASRGELIALLNNDTTVDPNWLEGLVLAIHRNPRIGATVPKIRFWGRFQTITLTATHPFTVNLDRLLASLAYKKLFVREGAESASVLSPAARDGAFRLEVDLPVQEKPIDLVLATDIEQMISILTALTRKVSRIGKGTSELALSLGDAGMRTGFHVINNVGSMELEPLKPGDRGFGERDLGQYDDPREVDLLCGCSAVIRRDALRGKNLFIDELVAYFEDSELSKRLRADGYGIQYCPQSIVYHKHSATNVERSAFWRKQTSRNAVLFEYMHLEPSAREGLIDAAKARFRHLRQHYLADPGADASEVAFADAVPMLCADLDRIAALIDEGKVPARSGVRIGLYNSFWKTFGGGEAHALGVATALAALGRVELICEEDFDLEELSRYFNIDASNFRKRIVREMTAAITEEYDVFVNSTFQSELVSRAKCSLFIVSFPSPKPSQEFLSSYYFLPNSNYTQTWMEKYWGLDRFRGEIFYPSIPEGMLLSVTDSMPPKRKLILSVGRFASSGHTKSQLEIARAFRMLCASHPSAAVGWSLVLAGTADDALYIAEITRELDGLNASVIVNASFERVRDLFRDAAVYVHASGFGCDADTGPELLEHFGMVVAQAMGAGCVPVVYGAGGPLEIICTAGLGYEYRSLDELVDRLAQLLPAITQRLPNTDEARRLVQSAQIFAKSHQLQQFNRILQREAAMFVRPPIDA